MPAHPVLAQSRVQPPAGPAPPRSSGSIGKRCIVDVTDAELSAVLAPLAEKADFQLATSGDLGRVTAVIHRRLGGGGAWWA